MEASRSLLSPPASLPRTHPRTPHTLSSPSVPMLYDQASRAVTSRPTTSMVQHFPTSVLSHEHRNDSRNFYTIKDEKLAQATLDRQHLEGSEYFEEREKSELEKCLKYFERRLLYQPGFWYLCPPFENVENLLPISTELTGSISDVVPDIESVLKEKENADSMRPGDVLALARKAMMATRKAASLAEKTSILAADFNESHMLSLDCEESTEAILIEEEGTIRSRRLLERRLKKRKVSRRQTDVVHDVNRSMNSDIRKKVKNLESNDPLKLFFWGPETKQLLTIKEEKALFSEIQNLMRLEEVKQRLQEQFNREPTLAEWAQAVGMTCHVLQSTLHSGNHSRRKMIYSNFRLVVHVAKKYEGQGLNIQDLLQEGSMGLMKSLEKFKPKSGCRFPTYAYWWIRQSIRKAIFQHSRTIRLPENVYALLKRIKDARRSCIQEGHLPTNEDLARRVGITVQKLESLLASSRNPISIQERAWADQDATIQEITADPEVEIPDLFIARKLMRQHTRSLLRILTPKERRIIQLRYGINDHVRKSLSEIGDILCLSKERIRQIESRALNKLKGCFQEQGLGAYVDLLN